MAKAPRMRALLIGVDTYHGADLLLRPGQADASVDAVYEALTEPPHALFRGTKGAGIRRLRSPARAGDIESAVNLAARSAPALFLLYYVGHGRLVFGADPLQDRLYLTVSETDPAHVASTAVALEDLVTWALAGDSERVVLVLDTCYSGNLTHHLLREGRNLSFLTSARQRQRVTAGEDGGVTPFTAALAEVLRAPGPPGHPLTVHGLGKALKDLAKKQPPATVFPWKPEEFSSGDGASTRLTRPLDTLPPASPPAEDDTADPGPLARLWHWISGIPRWRLFTAATILALLAASGVYALVRGGPETPCAPPVELRLATAPEEAAAMTDVATAYEASAFGTSCHRGRVSVTGAGLDALAEGFRDPQGWSEGANNLLSAAGPQPDLLLLPSSADLDRVRGPDTHFSTPVHIARDLPVLTVTADGGERLGLPDPGPGRVGTVDWPALRHALTGLKDHARLLRPSPALSGTGLVHYLGMGHDIPPAGHADPGGERGESFTYRTGTPTIPPAERDARERTLIAGGGSVLDGNDALCALLARRPAPHYAGALTTLRATRAFKAVDCERHPAEDPDTPLRAYRVAGAPALDHPLVRVGTDEDAARADEIEHFLTWVTSEAGKNALTTAHLDPAAREENVRLDPRHVADQLNAYRAAHPELRVEVVFDVSRSMAEDSKLTGARAAVDEALGHLGGKARYQVRVFPTGKDGEGSTLRDSPWQAKGTQKLKLGAKDVNKDRQADLVSVLGTVRGDIAAAKEADRSTPGDEAPHQYAVLLVTDGDYREGKRPQLDALADVAARLGRVEGAPVHVVATRPEGCASGYEADTVARYSGGGCTRLGPELAAALSRTVTALDEGED
ncbi:substrate-binding domain-containing protein [Streptomyces sp. NRRL F-5630]|uniref:substrate-binding domain-containing protein n=1 Tax=unclassified Streptomyces TaxID=2593676 RepID=UPI0004C7E870|nr:substrate-binding domain-containing protein [Streptomyces sp. NRRL F-5630]